ncbi:RNA-metabolising metallo-beta-lactamase [methanogenic archaeon mixed culture ISO4-G1]|nr:RNA-metabolising metallo-beta-lactamase [methanogenic archaeon mixed culture ISO4-G1]
MEMKCKFLGGADMVGRMGMTLEGDGMTALIEYGLSPTKPPEYPLPAPRVDYAFLTHSHLDHCGMIPQICGKNECDLFTTPLSAEIAELMMYDTLKIAKAEDYPQPYTSGDIERTMKAVVPMTYEDQISINHFDVTMLDAGHIPGAAMFQFEKDVSTIYSGDIHTEAQRLVGGAKPADCTNLFIEGTYGGRYHPDRKETEEAFIAKIEEVLDRGGKVLIPCFAVGRTQEIMLLLRNLGYEMWVDGMGRSVTRLFLDYPEYIRDVKHLKAAKRKFNEVRNANSRASAIKGEIIVTTGGMLDGGPVLGYLNAIKDDEKSAILLVGYQAEDTNGRMLLEEGCVKIDGEIVKISCELKKYDFSAHADHGQIVDFIRKCDPDNVIIMHSESREAFLPDLEGDYNVILPTTGQEFTLDM